MKFSNEPKRIVVFLFYDKEGIVDSYIPYMLKDMKENAQKLMVVVNGKINDEGKEKLSGIVDEIFERENIGFDVWGYKEAIEKIGWNELEKYDELVLMNYTIMGPVYPFKEMFDQMNKTDVDFWGITKYHRDNNDFWGLIECGYIHEHIQSHFIAMRKNLFMSAEFKNYWETMPMINSYEESIAFHETKFTHTFAELGYKWQPYVDTDCYEGVTSNPLIIYPTQLIAEKKCPIFKRRSFFHDYTDLIKNTAGEPSYELMRYLKQKTNYDTDMIWENILRCYNINEIKNCMHLNFVLPEKETVETLERQSYKNKKIALVFHAYFPDLIESTYRYINSMPDNADVYITTNTEEKKNFFEKQFKNNKFKKFEVILIENRGRDVSALLVATKDFIMDYDYVCFAHDKKSAQIDPGSVGISFGYHCLENVLGTEGYVKNIIEIFENDNRMGMLMPMPPMHSDFSQILGDEWGPNFDITYDLSKRLGLNVPILASQPPVTALGTMFWFRPVAMKKLFDADWRYIDFPKEPNAIDGTLLHAVERIYGYVVQDAGYYCGWCFNDYYARLSITNLAFYYKSLSAIANEAGISGRIDSVLYNLRNTIMSKKELDTLTRRLVSFLPISAAINDNANTLFKLYYSDGASFNEKQTTIGEQAKFGDTYTVVYNDFKNVSKFSAFRLDPGELGDIIISDFTVEYLLNDGTVKKADNVECQCNGIKNENKYLFLKSDPQLMWSTDIKADIKEVKITAKITNGVDLDDIVDAATAVSDSDENATLYYAEDGGYFVPDNNITTVYNISDGYYTCSFNVPEKIDNIGIYRFDPREKGNLVIEQLNIRCILNDGSDYVVDAYNCQINGANHGGKLMFVEDDPQIIWSLNPSLKISRIDVNFKIYKLKNNDILTLPQPSLSLARRILNKFKSVLGK